MKNKYSVVLWVILVALLLLGAFLIFCGAVITVSLSIIFGLGLILMGFVALGLGGLMFLGLKSATPSPTKVWLLTWFGTMTDVIVAKWPVLLLDWTPFVQPVGYVEFELKKREHQFVISKPIKCKPIDGRDGGYAYGMIDTTMVIDHASAENLRNLANSGMLDGVIKQLDGIFTATVQALATENAWSVSDLENGGPKIIKALVDRIAGLTGGPGENNTYDDIRGFGIKFEKFQPIFRPAEEVITAINSQAVEREKAGAKLIDTRTVNRQVEERLAAIAKLGSEKVTWVQCRNQILDENLALANKLTKVVNEGGLNVMNTNPPQGKP